MGIEMQKNLRSTQTTNTCNLLGVSYLPVDIVTLDIMAKLCCYVTSTLLCWMTVWRITGKILELPLLLHMHKN